MTKFLTCLIILSTVPLSIAQADVIDVICEGESREKGPIHVEVHPVHRPRVDAVVVIREGTRLNVGQDLAVYPTRLHSNEEAPNDARKYTSGKDDGFLLRLIKGKGRFGRVTKGEMWIAAWNRESIKLDCQIIPSYD